MDAHRLRSVIDLIIAEHRRIEIYHKLSRIQQTLDESASNPCSASDEQFRAALTSLLTALRGTTVNDLAALNGIANPNLIYVGQVLNVPGAGTPATRGPPCGRGHG